MIAGEDEIMFAVLQAGEDANLPFKISFPDLSAQFFKNQAITSLVQPNHMRPAGKRQARLKIVKQSGNDEARDFFLVTA